MILEDITNKLKEINPKVYYGIVDESERNSYLWDYIVFNRVKLEPSTNKTGYTYGYDVHIVCENFIPEDKDIEVIEKMLEISGMRLATDGGDYDYTVKPNTNTVVEVLTLHFVRARK